MQYMVLGHLQLCLSCVSVQEFTQQDDSILEHTICAKGAWCIHACNHMFAVCCQKAFIAIWLCYLLSLTEASVAGHRAAIESYVEPSPPVSGDGYEVVTNSSSSGTNSTGIPNCCSQVVYAI